MIMPIAMLFVNVIHTIGIALIFILQAGIPILFTEIDTMIMAGRTFHLTTGLTALIRDGVLE